MRLAPLLVTAGTAVALLGCGASADDQVRSKVEEFAHAAASRDYATICERVLAPALLSRLTTSGIPCPQAMQIALGSVRHPTLSIGSVTVRGASASVITLTTAEGQRASVATLELVRTAAGWRISALASPAG